jgi:hypothetical protein
MRSYDPGEFDISTPPSLVSSRASGSDERSYQAAIHLYGGPEHNTNDMKMNWRL